MFKTHIISCVSKTVICNITYLFVGETPGNFDVVIENNDLEKAYEILHNFVLINYSPHCSTGESNVFRFF